MLKFDKVLIIISPILIATAIVLFFPKHQSPADESQAAQITNYPPAGRAGKLPTANLFLAGDIMLSRNVAAKIYKSNDFALPFRKVAQEIQTADIAFANLESPFNNKGNHSAAGSLVFNADPKSIEGLQASGFDLLSTANNHSFDQGKIGIDYTKTLLSSHGILPVGTGLDCHDGQIIAKNQIKFGFLAYSYSAYNDGRKTADPLVCTMDEVQLAADIAKLKARADVVIVSMHAGTEYTDKSNPFQVNFAHAAIDAGADLVVGAHPHWVQNIENYQGKWIFYSLGNFVFDQMWSQDTKEGLTALFAFQKNEIKKIVLQPVIIDDFCCPRWANEVESLTILNKINPHTKGSVILDNFNISEDWENAINLQ